MPGGEAIMDSKYAALLLTELALGLRNSRCEAVPELLVLQLWPDCWRSAMSKGKGAAMLAVLVSVLVAVDKNSPTCNPVDSSI